MKKAIIRAVVLPILIAFLTIVSVLINSIYPPGRSIGQVIPPIDQVDSNRSKEAFEKLIEETKEKAAFIEGQKSVKSEKPKVIIREVIKKVPVVPKKSKSEKEPSEKILKPRPIVIYKSAPIYPGTQPRELSEFEKKEQQGLWNKLFKKSK